MRKEKLKVICAYVPEGSARKLIEQAFVRYLQRMLSCRNG